MIKTSEMSIIKVFILISKLMSSLSLEEVPYESMIKIEILSLFMRIIFIPIVHLPPETLNPSWKSLFKSELFAEDCVPIIEITNNFLSLRITFILSIAFFAYILPNANEFSESILKGI